MPHAVDILQAVDLGVIPSAYLVVSADEVHSWDSGGNWEGRALTLASDPPGFPSYSQPARLTGQLWVVFDNDDTPIVDCVDLLNGDVNTVANTGIPSWDVPASSNLKFHLLVWDPVTAKFFQAGWSKVGSTHTAWLRSFNADGSSPTGLYTRNTGATPPNWGLVGSGAFASWTGSGTDTREIDKTGSESTPSYDIVPNGSIGWESTNHGQQWWAGDIGGADPIASDATKMRELVDKPATSDKWPDDPELMNQNTVVAAPDDLVNPSPDSDLSHLFFLSDSFAAGRRPSYWWDHGHGNTVTLGPELNGIDGGDPPGTFVPFQAISP